MLAAMTDAAVRQFVADFLGEDWIAVACPVLARQLRVRRLSQPWLTSEDTRSLRGNHRQPVLAVTRGRDGRLFALLETGRRREFLPASPL